MKRASIVLTVLLAAVLACNLTWATPVPTPTPVNVAPFPTGIKPTGTPVVVSPTASAIPTPTPTFVWGPPIFTANVAANCRSGPSTDYPVLAGIQVGEEVPLIGVSTIDRPLWWKVTVHGVDCWVSGTLGTTKGAVFELPIIPAPPVPTPTMITADTIFVNLSGANICRLDFYVDITIVQTVPFAKKEFKDGDSVEFAVPVGHYDLIRAWNCKAEPVVVESIKNVTVDENGATFYFGTPPTATPKPTKKPTKTPTPTP